ncbi:MAG: two-component sensor histidine kinase [Catenulispora sp.]|nr:two-component sensor histidine kinase [Catenulispora sp.]
MGVNAWNRLMARQELLLLSAVTAMVLFAAVTFPTDVRHALHSHQPLSWLVSGVVYAALPALRRQLIGGVAIAATGTVVLMADGTAYPLTLPAVFYTLYAVALRCGPGRTLAVGVTVKAALLAASLITHPGITGYVILLGTALAVTSGSASQSHRRYIAEAENRAQRAEQDREREAQRRVAQERLRIARDLHDAVGHHVALITVQAGALACLLDDEDLVQARESLTHIQRAGEEALEELRLTVGLLREPGTAGQLGSAEPAEQTEPQEPVPGLDRLQELICSFADVGLQVKQEIIGRARRLPDAVELTAYRVIQESLTNTRKHAGCDSASIRIEYTPAALSVAVEDEGKATGYPQHMPGGYGVVGMQERVAALGGRLTAGPRSEGGYRVFAELPLRAARIEA